MNTGLFVECVIGQIVDYVNSHVGEDEQLSHDDISVRTASRILGNNEALISTKSMLFRAQYDGAKDRLEITAYKAWRSFDVEGIAGS